MGGWEDVRKSWRIARTRLIILQTLYYTLFVTYFIEQCVFDVSAILCQFRHALFQADSGV
jgi:hypothetical protein